MVKISHSEVDAFLLCRRKDFYNACLPNPDGTFGVQRKKMSDSLNRGILTHEVLASFFTHLLNNPKDYSGAYQAGKQHILAAVTANPDMLEVTASVSSLYDFFWNSQWFVGYEVLYVEEKFYLEISDDLTYPFTVDLIVRDSRGAIVVVDHKTTYNFYTQEQIDLSPQLPKYIGGLRALGIRADYALYHQLKHRITAKSTTEDVIKLHRFEPSVKRIQTSFTEQIETARHIQQLRSLPTEEVDRLAIRTANNLVCNSCSFKELCINDLNGKSNDLLIEASFTSREERY